VLAEAGATPLPQTGYKVGLLSASVLEALELTIQESTKVR